MTHSRPSFAEAIRNFNAGRLAQAEAACRKLLATDPRHAESLHLLGVIASQAKQYVVAVAFIRKAIAIEEGRAPFRTSLGRAYRMLQRLDEAVECCRCALTIDPTFADAHYELAAALYRQGGVARTIDHCRRAIELKPDHTKAHDRLGAAHLLLGDFDAGWPEYEWRPREPRGFGQPQWRGEPLQGEPILLHADQDFGDTLQFVRYAPLVAARGGRVVLEVQSEHYRLMSSLPGVETVIARGTALPDFAWHCPLASLPFAFRTTLATIPAQVPYLNAAPALVRSWVDRLGSTPPRIGLVWAGAPAQTWDQPRSLRRLSLLAPLAKVEEAAFFSLQVGPAAAQVNELAAELPLVDLSPYLSDYAETAAAIAGLDLVISSDTSVVHLAGALGKPVWILLACVADWIWLLDREDSPWYPTARLFRQPAPGAWPAVIDRVADELRRVVAGDRSVLWPRGGNA
jgi:Flp pilus assembly protein TadD